MTKKLIEETFPLRETSIDAVHEKNVRHGHISTLHIWPARRPLAAARAALITALLDDPGNDAEREFLKEKIGGKVVVNPKNGREETEGGILHWGREKSDDVAWFREKIRAQYGGAPKVLDMFAGGGAIPLEAMRLGCDVTAIDYNPVAWFLLKCTLDYPHRLAGKKWPLPTAEESETPLSPESRLIDVETGEGDLAAHVRWWGRWVLERARKDLEEYYPTEPRDPSRPAGKDNPLCPTVAYLWARTIPHPDPRKKGLRVPLLKTMWLCKKKGDDSVEEGEDGVSRRKSIAKKRALKMHYNAEKNAFEFEIFEPKDDSEVGPGTMQRSGVQCPPTGDEDALAGGTFIPSSKIQELGKAGELGAVCTAVVMAVPFGKKNATRKEYRLPTKREIDAAFRAKDALEDIYSQIPYGIPTEPIDPPDSRAIFVHLYGINEYKKLFTDRQLLALGTFIAHTRKTRLEIEKTLGESGKDLSEAITAYLAITIDRLADRSSTICRPDPSPTQSGVVNTFSRFALPMTWDFIEGVTTSSSSGSYEGCIEFVEKVVKEISEASNASSISSKNESATSPIGTNTLDAIVTDPPYYDAIPYADLSDFFYVWLKRTIGDTYPSVFASELTPKIGELVQHTNRDGGKEAARKAYEDGMAQAFSAACKALKPDGRMVIVFAHKDPDAWETLASAMIRAGFTITASWPIDTEMGNRTRAQNSAALSSSVWLVCRKRPANAGKGNLNAVRKQMQARITERLRYFYDLKIRGADLLWAAIGPGLESYSAYDSVANLKGEPFTVKDFIAEVHRVTTKFVLGGILHGDHEGLDKTTCYALIHLHHFGMGPAPVGECILLAGAHGLELSTLTGPRGLLVKGKVKAKKVDDGEGDDGASDASESGGSGSDLRLLRWDERKHPDLGEPHPAFGLPFVDMLHRLLREWESGDPRRVEAYMARNGLGDNELFWRVAQAFAQLTGTADRSKIDALIQLGKGNTRLSAMLYEAELAMPAKKNKPVGMGRLMDIETGEEMA